MIALSLLRRNPATHGVFLGSLSSIVKKNELQSGKEDFRLQLVVYLVFELFD